MAVAVVPRETSSIAVRQIPVASIEIGANVRVDQGDLEGLAASIRELGVLQPVKAIEHPGGRYRLVWGQRRYLAAQLAGLETIPALIVNATDIDSPGPNRAIEQLVENLDRRDLNPIEEAKALREVLDANGTLTQAALAERLGRSPSWLANSLRLLEAAPAVQEALRTGELSAAHAKAVLGLSAEKQASLAKSAIARNTSAHDLEREATWAREDMKRQEKDAGRQEKIAKQAIAALEKAAAKDALVVVSGARIANAIKAAGWTNLYKGERYDVDVLKQAGECGCSAWIVEWDAYGTGEAAKVKPACADKAHRETRRAAIVADREHEDAERDVAAKERERTSEADRRAIAERFRLAFTAGLEPAERRALLWMLASHQSIEWDYRRAKAVEHKDSDQLPSLWALIERLDDATVFEDLCVIGANRVVPSPRAHWAQEAEPVARMLLEDRPAPTVQSEAAERVKTKRAARVDELVAAGKPFTADDIDATPDDTAPLCTCGRPKVDAGDGRWVCTNPVEHPSEKAPKRVPVTEPAPDEQ